MAFKISFLLGLAVLSVALINSSLWAQTTEDCGEVAGCFIYPTNCRGRECQFIYKWSDSPLDNSTNFQLNARIDANVSIYSAWVGIGFAKKNEMGDDNAVLCLNSPSLVRIGQYYSPNKSRPFLIDDSQPSLGLSLMKVATRDDFLTCSFRRVKSNSSNQFYFDLNNQFNILAAYGMLDSNNTIIYHEFKIPTNVKANFQTTQVINGQGQ